MQPLGDRLLIKKLVPENTTKSGLLLPNAPAGATEVAEIIAIGPGPLTADGVYLKIPLNVGDLIVLRSHYGVPIMIDGEEYHILDTKEAMGKTL